MVKCSSFLGAESEEAVPFLKSLQELKELRGQVHHAADYCEMAFSKTEEKKEVLDSTREYICRAVITVVDHLGAVSTNLDSALRNSDRVSEVEIRINSIRQKILSHEHYNHTLLISKFRLRGDTQRIFPRYIMPSAMSSSQLVGKSTYEAREPDDTSAVTVSVSSSTHAVRKKKPVEVEKDLPLFMYTNTSHNNQKLPISSKIHLPPPRPAVAASETHSKGEINHKQNPLASVLPIRDALAAPTQTKKVTFHFQATRKNGRGILHWRSVRDTGGEMLSILRRSKSKKGAV